MPDYLNIVQGLVDYGYLDKKDVDIAVDLLAEILVVDESARDEAILEAEARADTAVATDDVPIETIYQVEVHDDVANVAGDAEILAAGDVISTFPFTNAADGLVAANLIDERNADAVASLIAAVWLDDN